MKVGPINHECRSDSPDNSMYAPFLLVSCVGHWKVDLDLQFAFNTSEICRLHLHNLGKMSQLAQGLGYTPGECGGSARKGRHTPGRNGFTPRRTLSRNANTPGSHDYLHV